MSGSVPHDLQGPLSYLPERNSALETKKACAVEQRSINLEPLPSPRGKKEVSFRKAGIDPENATGGGPRSHLWESCLQAALS
jgi:hypothetical protein